MKLHRRLLSISAFLCFALCHVSHVFGVNPAPDGGYPRGNTAEGQNALLSLTTGGYNTAIGFFSLRGDTTGSGNTAIGAGALLANTGDQNTAIGIAALLSNSGGSANTANGALALLSNSFGGGNAAFGCGALYSNITGSSNTATGYGTLKSNTTGIANTAVGSAALDSATADGNTAIGAAALFNLSNGFDNTALGINAGLSVTTAHGVICIGAGVVGADIDESCFIGSIRGVTTASNDAVPVLIDSEGQLGTASSSRRYKTDIKPLDKESESILALKPVSFHYKLHKDKKPQFGLIAEEVAAVNPDLVVCDKRGEIYTVRYDAVNALLLNEFLKQHQKVQKLYASDAQLKKEIAEQREQIRTLMLQLSEQVAEIRKVSAAIQASKVAPQMARNP